MKILFVASECAPFAKVGGLADVVGSLPKTLKKLGVDVSVAIPFYSIIDRKDKKLASKHSVKFEGKDQPFTLWQTFLPKSNVPVYLIESDQYFKKGGVYIEEDASSGGSREEAARFLFLSAAGLEIAKQIKAQIVHCHDWHVSLIPLLAKEFKTLLTIHNLAYQGIYSTKTVNELLGTDLPSQNTNCLQQGILNADLISTVSPNYAKEITTKEYGHGLDEELKKKKPKGILNGLDINFWNPETDPHIRTKYSIDSLNKKEENKTYLQEKFFKKTSEVPLIGIVSRLAEQKGFDLIKNIFSNLMKEDLNFILLGKGTPQYQSFFQEQAQQYSDKFKVEIGFNEELAHQIYAGSDIFLMPSYFEPCGLGQMIAMRYGTVPVVRETGGLKDTVINQKTGFTFKDYKEEELLKAIKESLSCYRKKKIWKKIQTNGMNKDFSWEKSAKEYLKIYRKLI